MNNGFMLYEALIVLLIISFSVVAQWNTVYTLNQATLDLQAKINELVTTKYEQFSCNLECIIKKDL